MGSSEVELVMNGDVEEAILTVTARIDKLEKKIDLLILAVERVESLLGSIQPILKFINNLPLIR